MIKYIFFRLCFIITLFVSFESYAWNFEVIKYSDQTEEKEVEKFTIQADESNLLPLYSPNNYLPKITLYLNLIINTTIHYLSVLSYTQKDHQEIDLAPGGYIGYATLSIQSLSIFACFSLPFVYRIRIRE